MLSEIRHNTFNGTHRFCFHNGFERTGHDVLKSWLCLDDKPFNIVAINAGMMGAEGVAQCMKQDVKSHLNKYAISYTEDAIMISEKVIKGDKGFGLQG